MLKWFCEDCRQYRPYTQQHCTCQSDGHSMFGDTWEEEEPEVRMVRLRREKNRRETEIFRIPQNA